MDLATGWVKMADKDRSNFLVFFTPPQTSLTIISKFFLAGKKFQQYFEKYFSGGSPGTFPPGKGLI